MIPALMGALRKAYERHQLLPLLDIYILLVFKYGLLAG
jgi:hypothetical protein